MTKKQVLDLAKKHNVKFINLQFVDILGIVKNVTIPCDQLERVIDHNQWFDGSSIEGFARIFESDMYLKPVLSTFRIIPWEKTEDSSTARIICEVYSPDGAPYNGDPMYVLKRVVKEAEKMGYTFYVGPELEFNIFKIDADRIPRPLPHDRGGYFDYTTDLAQEVRQDMTSALQAMGIEVECLHHEVAPGQHEIDFKYSDAITTADNATTLKYTLKAIAGLYDLHVSFMPKPVFGINGVGMHIHQSLFKNGKNVFVDKKDKYRLSETAKQFIAGQMHHIKDMSAILSPTVNSYKRLVPGFEAPVYIAWGTTNRSALIRIPRVTPGRESSIRCELRCADPSCNPYLAFAVCLAAGLDGIKKKMKPPNPVEENIYSFTENEAKKRKIKTLPIDLGRAIKNFKKSELMRKTLGDHIFNKYYEAKKAEWNEYRTQVTQWELDRYLEVY